MLEEDLEELRDRQSLAWLEDLPPLGRAQGYPQGGSSWVNGAYEERSDGVAQRGPLLGKPGPPSISDVPGRGKREVGRPQVNHHFLDLARRRLRPHLRKSKAEVLCWDRLKGFRKEIWFLVVAGYSPNFIRDFLTGELSKIFPTLSWGGVVSSVAKISKMAREGKIRLDEECREILEDYEAGPWAPNAPDWLREQYGVSRAGMVSLLPDSRMEAGFSSGGSILVSPTSASPISVSPISASPVDSGLGVSVRSFCGEVVSVEAVLPPVSDLVPGLVPVVSAYAPGMDEEERLGKFLRAWKMMVEFDPSMGTPTLEEMVVGSTGGLAAVAALRKSRMGVISSLAYVPVTSEVPVFEISISDKEKEESVLDSEISDSVVPVAESLSEDAYIITEEASEEISEIPVSEIPVSEVPVSEVPEVFTPTTEKADLGPASLIENRDSSESSFRVDPFIRPMFGFEDGRVNEKADGSAVISEASASGSASLPVPRPVPVSGEGGRDFTEEGDSCVNPVSDFGSHSCSNLGSLEDSLNRSMEELFQKEALGNSPETSSAVSDVISQNIPLKRPLVEPLKVSAVEPVLDFSSGWEREDFYLEEEEVSSVPASIPAPEVSAKEVVLKEIVPVKVAAPEVVASEVVPTQALASVKVLVPEVVPTQALASVKVLVPEVVSPEVVASEVVLEVASVLTGDFILDPIRNVRELPWEMLQRGLDQGLNLEGHQNFFPELTGRTIEDVYASWDAAIAPDGYRKFELDRYMVENGLRAGKSFDDLYRQIPGASPVLAGQTALFLFIEAIVERAFGLRTDRLTSAGEPVMHYAACWNLETAREMKERGARDWFYPMNPMRIQSRKPATLADVPEGYFWIDFWGLFPLSVQERMDRMRASRVSSCLETGLLKDGRGVLQDQEEEFYHALFAAIGYQETTVKSKRLIDPFIYFKPHPHHSVGKLPQGSIFLGLSKSHDPWMDISGLHGNFWRFNSTNNLEPFDALASGLQKIHTKFHKPSVDYLDKFIYSSIVDYRRRLREIT